MNTLELGSRGEDAALEYLLSLGMVLRERNFRIGHKEIDLIMESDKYLHIVEVRTRSSDSVMLPYNTVQLKKQRLIISAARFYIKRYAISKDISFDIVSIVLRHGKYEIEYLPRAFYPFY